MNEKKDEDVIRETEIYSEDLGELIDVTISGETFQNKVITCSSIEGLAIFEGDIVIGTVEKIEFSESPQPSGISGVMPRPSGIIHSYISRRWPEGVVPYTFSNTFPSGSKYIVEAAIKHWNDETNIQLVARTTQTDYIKFKEDTGNSSYVGRTGGEQLIWLDTSNFITGIAIHEIGHAVGLWHEQSREDRDNHVKIHYDNIIPEEQHNFYQHISDGDDVGHYDYGSIMHYSPYAFAIDRSRPTITTIPPGNEYLLGQRNGLSLGDKYAVQEIYIPSGLEPLQLVEYREEIKFNDNQETSFQTTIKNPNRDYTLKNVEIILEIPYTDEGSLVYIPNQKKSLFFDSLRPLEEKTISIELNIREINEDDFSHGTFYFYCILNVNHSYGLPIPSDVQRGISIRLPVLCILPSSTNNYVYGHIYFKTKDETLYYIPEADVSLYSNASEGLLYDYSEDIPDGHCFSGKSINLGGYLIIAEDKFYKMKISSYAFYSGYHDVDLRGNNPIKLDIRLYHRPPIYDGGGFLHGEEMWILENCIIGVPHPSENPNWVPNTDGLENPIEEEDEESGWIPE